MAIHLKKVESFQIILTTPESFTVEDILTSDETVEREQKVKGKNISYRILQNSRKFIVGLIETSRNENIPPKKNRRNKTISGLGLTEDEGLVYANVFIFEKKRKILMYEVNKFGCYVNHFLDYLYKCCRNSETFREFSLNLNPILKANEYRRMLRMAFHKSVEIKLARPSQIIDAYRHENDAIWNLCKSGSNMHSETVQTKFEVSARGNSSGLASTPVKRIVDRVLEILRSPIGENVEKLQVVGYETDSEDGRLETIDLIADRYINYIELDEPRENSDLLEFQRKGQIVALYGDCEEAFDEIFGIDE